MAFTFDCVQKATTQNSYVCEAEANDYFDGNPRSDTWAALSVLEKQQYLVASTNRLEMENFGGSITEDTQALQWPRNWVVDRNNDYYDPDTLPKQMQHATYELALWMIDENNETPLVSRVDMERMTEYKVGPLSVKTRKVRESALPDIVKRSLESIGPDAWLGSAGLKLVR